MEMKSWRAWEAEGTAKTNSIFQRPSWPAGLGPLGSLETEASLGLLVTQSFPCSAPFPRAKGSLFQPLPRGIQGLCSPAHPRLFLLLPTSPKSHSEVSLGKAFPDSANHSTSSVSLHFCPTRLVGGVVVVVCVCGVCGMCVWHVYMVCVVCVWCVSGL